MNEGVARLEIAYTVPVPNIPEKLPSDDVPVVKLALPRPRTYSAGELDALTENTLGLIKAVTNDVLDSDDPENIVSTGLRCLKATVERNRIYIFTSTL